MEHDRKNLKINYNLLSFLLAFFNSMPAYSSHGEHVSHEIGLMDILIKSNLLNIIVLAGAMIYLANKFLPKVIDERKAQILKELEQAKNARMQAEKELLEIKEKCKNISLEIEQIKEESKKTASGIQRRIETGTEEEIEKIKVRAKKEIDSAQNEAVQKIQKSASDAAIKLAEEALIKISEDPDVQDKLIDDFLDELDSPSNN